MVLHWQNLIHQKCPICNSKLERIKSFFKCLTKDCNFIIGESRLLEIIINPETQRHMTDNEKEILNKALQKLGVIK